MQIIEGGRHILGKLLTRERDRPVAHALARLLSFLMFLDYCPCTVGDKLVLFQILQSLIGH